MVFQRVCMVSCFCSIIAVSQVEIVRGYQHLRTNTTNSDEIKTHKDVSRGSCHTTKWMSVECVNLATDLISEVVGTSIKPVSKIHCLKENVPAKCEVDHLDGDEINKKHHNHEKDEGSNQYDKQEDGMNKNRDENYTQRNRRNNIGGKPKTGEEKQKQEEDTSVHSERVRKLHSLGNEKDEGSNENDKQDGRKNKDKNKNYTQRDRWSNNGGKPKTGEEKQNQEEEKQRESTFSVYPEKVKKNTPPGLQKKLRSYN